MSPSTHYCTTQFDVIGSAKDLSVSSFTSNHSVQTLLAELANYQHNTLFSTNSTQHTELFHTLGSSTLYFASQPPHKYLSCVAGAGLLPISQRVPDMHWCVCSVAWTQPNGGGRRLFSQNHSDTTLCPFCGLGSNHHGIRLFFAQKHPWRPNMSASSARLSTHISTPPKMQTSRQMFFSVAWTRKMLKYAVFCPQNHFHQWGMALNPHINSTKIAHLSPNVFSVAWTQKKTLENLFSSFQNVFDDQV